MNLVQTFSLGNSHVELVSMTVLLLEVTGRAKADEATINHNCNTIAESFCLVHPVSSQHNSRVLKMLEQLEKTAAGDWIDSGCWLIQEFDQRICEQGYGAAQLSLIASTEIRSELIPLLSQVKGLLDEVPLELYICGTQPLDAPDHVEVLINRQFVPDQVVLSTQAKPFSISLTIEVI